VRALALNQLAMMTFCATVMEPPPSPKMKRPLQGRVCRSDLARPCEDGSTRERFSAPEHDDVAMLR
jgi:hypothetical protein